MAITKDTLMEDLRGIEAAEEVLMMRGLICGNCNDCEANFGTIADVAKEHGLNAEKLVQEMNDAIDAAEED